MEVKKAENRIHFLDELRGICIICMVFFHAFFDIAFFYEWKLGIRLFEFFSPAVPWFAGLFIFISGVCCHLSRSNIKRGAQLLLIAMGMTIITSFMDDLFIAFGILHLLSIGMLLYGLLEKFIKKIPLWLGLTVCAAVFVLTYSISYGYYIGFPGLFTVHMPVWLTENPVMFIFGIINDNFVSGDYFPLLPWLFLFIAGTLVGRYVRKLPEILSKKRFKPLCFVGRHTLLIYVLHQPVILLFVWLFTLIV